MNLKIYFTDFWSDFIPNDNLFFRILSKKFNIEITPNNPDILFFSNFGNNHINFNCKKVYFTGENLIPDYYDYDYAMAFIFDDNNPNYYRLPLYALYDDVSKLLVKDDPIEILKKKTKFCNFIYSNPTGKKRNAFFKKLNKYKRVDAAGRVLNNTGYLVRNKREFIKDYKFTIAFENESSEGYTSEKIFEPMLSDTMPIYWGNPLVNLDFNKNSFVFANDFDNLNDLVDYIIELDQNDNLYLEKLKQSYFNENKINSHVNNDNILEFLENIINDKKTLNGTKSYFFNSNNDLKLFYKLKLKTHSNFLNYRRIGRFVSLKKPIMRFKTRNLKLKD
jgi:hypothetical protein